MTGSIWGRVQFIMQPRGAKLLRRWRPGKEEGIYLKKRRALVHTRTHARTHTHPNPAASQVALCLLSAGCCYLLVTIKMKCPSAAIFSVWPICF